MYTRYGKMVKKGSIFVVKLRQNMESFHFQFDATDTQCCTVFFRLELLTVDAFPSSSNTSPEISPSASYKEEIVIFTG
jgi:hypothetical protein